jgi:membrane associated rhomboid family serine protease
VFIPDGYLPPLNTLTLLCVLVALEFLGLVGRWRSIDHWAHIGGYLSGIGGAYLLKHRRSTGGGGGGQLHRPSFLSRRFLEDIKLR